MICVIDYGVGNLFSLTSSLKYLGLETVVTSDEKIIRESDRIILPGVGAFCDAYKKLEENNLVEVIKDEAKNGKPFLGICLGMQLLFDRSYEYGEHKGLGLIEGDVCPLSGDISDKLKIPHIGWNSLHFVRESKLFKYVSEGDFVYYVHSYYAKNCLKDTIAVSEYGIPVTGAVGRDNVFGTQFHPEKSGTVGLNILKGFSEV